VHSVLYLILCFFSIAGHYVLLNAQFLAIVHIIVYSGAIMVLFLFVVMLLNLNADSEPTKPIMAKLNATIAGGLLFLVLLAAFQKASLPSVYSVSNPATSDIGLVKNLGKVLFNDYLLPFEMTSVLFISAMVGAVMLGKKELE
jgi:NADH-quinone oxidoreductase subunit J